MNKLKGIKHTKLFDIIRYCRYLLYRFCIDKKFLSCKLQDDITIKRILNTKESFFGYYTISPENNNGKIIVCSPEKDEILKIFVKKKEKVFFIGDTKSWNWQQGCMAQWGYTNQNLIYYNRFNENKSSYETMIYDISSHKITDSLNFPVYSLSKQEDYALSLNFDRLALMRPDYGYFCKKNINLPDNNDDGIWKTDINTKKTTLIISLQKLIDINPVSSMKGAQHKVNHIDISPDGNRFMFLHRWVGPMGRFMRLITADRDGNDIYILNGDKMTSHSFWYGNNKILSFCYTPKFGNAYVFFTDKSDKIELVSEKLPNKDGHPSVSPDKKYIITDTYPDFARMSRLFIYNINNDNLSELGHFYQPLKYMGTKRIDLHPKWDMNGSSIYFESGHNGKRNLYRINVPEKEK